MKLLFLILMCLPLFAFGSSNRLADDNLTLALSQLRKEQVKNISYKLAFELNKGRETFEGKAIIDLTLNHIKTPLSFDFLIKKIKSIKVNGVALNKYPIRKGSFDLPTESLKEKMILEIDYIGEFNKEASGIQRVKDPEDGSEYIYTDFEPYHSHKLFPGLDQPDLKATFEVSVLAPQDWTIIQNELIRETSLVGDKKLTKFHPTKLISTYLFFLGAGPFTEWTDSYNGLPLYLYARKSMAKYVDAERIMETTKKGLKFFNEYFDYPYPFSKYGHIFIPEFAWGGMENPGAVTLNERGIFRGPVSQSRYEGRNNLILHEMAHMWFGDLVTMKWWNDLWLNESFATYLAGVAQERALGSRSTWIDFFEDKTWGYWQDQLITTHPIETEVPDVRSAKGNFDGITYSKGASALKQLHFYVGDEAFRNGLRAYFKKYAFSNTTREDFINAIGAAASTDLSIWTSKWLQTAGPNKVKVDFDCNDNEISRFSIIQAPSTSQTLSPHRTRLALYEFKGGRFELLKNYDASYSEEKNELSSLIGSDCPDFIFPNFEDHDYALFSLDPRSLKMAKDVLLKHPDPLIRLMVWHTLSQMVRNSELKAATYIQYAIEGLKIESDDLLLGSLIGRYSTIKSQYQSYLTKEEREKMAPEMESVLLSRMSLSPKGSSLQMNFYDFYVAVAQTHNSQIKLLDFLKGKSIPEGLTIDQDRRWNILLNLSSHGHKDALKLLSEELKKDGSTLGKRMALAARAAYPDLKIKKEIWRELTANKNLTHSDKLEAGRWLYDSSYPDLISPFVDDFLSKASRMKWSDHDDLVEVYFERLFPGELCSADFAGKSKKMLKSAKGLSPLAKRSWLEAQDELERCVRVRAFSVSGLSI